MERTMMAERAGESEPSSAGNTLITAEKQGIRVKNAGRRRMRSGKEASFQ